MFDFRIKKTTVKFLTFLMVLAVIFTPLTQVRAADHLEATTVSADPGADIGDVYAFLDPNDNTKVVLAMTVAGFIVPSEQTNFGFFPEGILYRFEIENTGDAIPDGTIDVTFSPQTSRSQPQTATIKLSQGRGQRGKLSTFNAPTTLPTLSASPNPFVVTNVSTMGIKFFAGLTDDPFYFDIPGFNRFVSSVLGGSPDPTRLQRSRDSFAGYNIHTIALSVPASLLQGPAGNIIGINGVTLRQRNTTRQNDGTLLNSGNYVQVDRMGVPAANTALIPFPRKNEYNAATPQDDANGVFAGDIVATLTALGTNSTNIGILASVAVANGDMLRLNLATPNTSIGFGERVTTAGYTGFPNGRRTGDDTVDTLLYFITNQAITMGDNVNSNEVPIPNSFPYFAPPNQPLENPNVDTTQN